MTCKAGMKYKVNEIKINVDPKVYMDNETFATLSTKYYSFTLNKTVINYYLLALFLTMTYLRTKKMNEIEQCIVRLNSEKVEL